MMLECKLEGGSSFLQALQRNQPCPETTFLLPLRRFRVWRRISPAHSCCWDATAFTVVSTMHWCTPLGSIVDSQSYRL